MNNIETFYNGTNYRSRLEARYAVLFDSLKLEYVYEPECFITYNGFKYTPDFYLPKYNIYVEIKPNYDWLKDDYHFNRYLSVNIPLLVLTGSYPNFNVNAFFDNNFSNRSLIEVVFCPNTKYEPFFFSGNTLGEEESLFIDDYSKNINDVKKYRFYK